MRKLRIFDTTLRDGEQTPGVSLNPTEKLELALQLEQMGVDIIEAGFPVTSPGDFEAVSLCAHKLTSSQVSALCRAVKTDIDRAWQAVSHAHKPGLHVFIATSEVHMKHKLNKSAREVLAMASKAVEYAASLGCEVQFSAEDATRTDPEFLSEVMISVCKAGADVINIPDTVGYTTPGEFGQLITYIKSELALQGLHPKISVHCHNDLGLAVSNSLEAVRCGIDQIECTINGLGERAGNAALEEIVMALATRKDRYSVDINVDTTRIWPMSRKVSLLTGISVQPNKAIVGKNAFAHESGIHQDGMLKNRSTYEIMTPESVGVPSSDLILGKTSGRHAFKARLTSLGVDLSADQLDAAFARFKQLADRKQTVSDVELMALVDHVEMHEPRYRLCSYQVAGGNSEPMMARVCLHVDESKVSGTGEGMGPVEALFSAVDAAISMEVEPKLKSYAIQAVTGGQDALGEVMVTLEVNDRQVAGRGLSMDILEASARAYVDAINRASNGYEGRMKRAHAD